MHESELAPVAKIVSWNTYGEVVTAAAARISTTPGDSLYLFDDAQMRDNNGRLIEKVIGSGHRSVLEHMVFSIAFQNVSVYVEQFMIECRLAFFTVKSRRYVDYTHQGFHTPDDLTGGALAFYKRYMSRLFEAYGHMLDMGVPKEDARFLLPYSFCSNFYCTLNARELIRVIQDMRFGRGAHVVELQLLARQLMEQILEKASFLKSELEKPYRVNRVPFTPTASGCVKPYYGNQVGSARLLNGPYNSEVLDLLYAAEFIGGELDLDEDIDISKLLASDRPRALEQLNYTFIIRDISLSTLTHVTRHRMQNLIVQPLENIDYDKIIVPNTVMCESAIEAEYMRVVTSSVRDIQRAANDDILRPYLPYFALSGNLIDVMTTMNARELMLFIRLRACNRAQWEVRRVAVNMLRLLRGRAPELFNYYGPSCYLAGKCPEGRMSCGKMAEMQEMFRRGNSVM